MSDSDETQWDAAYPTLAEACRTRVHLAPDLRSELAPNLSDDDFSAGVQRVSRYLGRLAASDGDLIYEEYFLVLSLAAQACVIQALAPQVIETKRDQIEEDLLQLVGPFRKWLGGDLQRAHASHIQRWPFPELLRG